MDRKYRMEYRQRVFFCEKCNLRIEFLGKGPLGKCHCCGVPLKDLPKEIDNLVVVKKTVSALRSEEE